MRSLFSADTLREEIGQRDFIYKADLSRFDSSPQVHAAAKTISSFVARKVRAEGIAPLQIEALSFSNLKSSGRSAVCKAFLDLATYFRVDLDKHSPSIVYCQAASLHNDPSFEGLSFASYVLSTGSGKDDGAYLVNATSGLSVRNEIDASSLGVRSGDLFVFNPSIAHCSFPLQPSRTSFLILFQWELSDKSEEDRALILDSLPPSLSYDTAKDYL